MTEKKTIVLSSAKGLLFLNGSIITDIKDYLIFQDDKLKKIKIYKYNILWEQDYDRS